MSTDRKPTRHTRERWWLLFGGSGLHLATNTISGIIPLIAEQKDTLT